MDHTKLVEQVEEDPILVWLLLRTTYARERRYSGKLCIGTRATGFAVGELVHKRIEQLLDLGLFEENPTARATFRCTEAGEAVAQALLTKYRTGRT